MNIKTLIINAVATLALSLASCAGVSSSVDPMCDLTTDSTALESGKKAATKLTPQELAQTVVDNASSATIADGPSRFKAFIDGVMSVAPEKRAEYIKALDALEDKMSIDERAELYVRIATPEAIAGQLNADPDPALNQAIRKQYEDSPEAKKAFNISLK